MITVEVCLDQEIEVSVEDCTCIDVVIEDVVVNASITIPSYEGEYVITPKLDEDVVLDTAMKKMLDDVVVKEIPYCEVANEAGGYTFIIG